MEYLCCTQQTPRRHLGINTYSPACSDLTACDRGMLDSTLGKMALLGSQPSIGARTSPLRDYDRKCPRSIAMLARWGAQDFVVEEFAKPGGQQAIAGLWV